MVLCNEQAIMRHVSMNVNVSLLAKRRPSGRGNPEPQLGQQNPFGAPVQGW